MSERLAQLQKLYHADPNDPFVTYGIALEHAKAEQHDRAISWLDATIQLDSHYHYAYFQKAKALSAKGEEDQARATLETGIERAKQANDAKALGELQELLETI